jgi:dienelactone hydrolase
MLGTPLPLRDNSAEVDGNMDTQQMGYRDQDTPLTGFLAWDDTRGSQRPGILVVHGGAGLDEHAKQRAQHIAELGFVAFACDMYGDGVAGDRQRVMACAMELRDNPERLCQRAQAGIDVLAANPHVDGRLAAVGYCFGGMTVLQLARSGIELAGVVSIHGNLKTTRPTQGSVVKARVLVCHGALDPHVPMGDVAAFIEEMNRAAVDFQLIVYGNAMHGFTHENASAYKVPGVAYNARADARSSAAMELFFAELFGSETSTDQSRP